MTRTMADHARAYRQRKAKKLERLAVLEAALREIVEDGSGDPGYHLNDYQQGQWDARENAASIARKALNPTTSQEQGA